MIEVIVNKNETTARDNFGKSYSIESIVVGSGRFKKEIKWTKGFLKEGSECRYAELLPNGKIKILLNNV